MPQNILYLSEDAYLTAPSCLGKSQCAITRVEIDTGESEPNEVKMLSRKSAVRESKNSSKRFLFD